MSDPMNNTSDPPAVTIISREVDDEDEWESVYRLRIGNRVKYLTIAPATFDRDTLSLPLASLPPLPYQDDTWTTALISRDAESGELQTRLSEKQLAAVQGIWHSARINVLDLQRTEQLSSAVFEATISKSAIPSLAPQPPQPPLCTPSEDKVTVIAKIARFEWEIQYIEQETRAYLLLQQRGAYDLAPRFLGHLHEGGRVMGFLLEKLDSRRNGGASIADLGACEAALARFHGLGLLHGDANRYNFLFVGRDGGGEEVKLIDFEKFQENASEQMRRDEMQSLRDELAESTGRGGGYRFNGNEN